MEVRFQTKEESNQQQLEEFLKLSKSERVWQFFSMVERFSKFPTKHREDKSSNYTIVIPVNKK